MAQHRNVLNDISTLTKVPAKALTELTSKEILCIGSAIHDALEAGEEALILNIGIGLLSINLIDMQCKFTPNKELKSTIKRCITTKVDPLEFELERALSEKLLSICDEVF